MFQNLAQEEKEDITYESTETKKEDIKTIIKKLFTKQNIFMYILSFALSTVSGINGMAPFGLAIFSASLSNGIPAGIIYIATIIGTAIGFGGSGVLTYILNSLVFVAMVLIFKPWYQDEYKSERMKLGKYVFASTVLVQVIQIIFRGFLFYDALLAIITGMVTYIFYKIFASSIITISEYDIKKAFTVEEVVGTSLMLSVATCALGNFSIYGFEVKIIASILIVLVLGWKNGILIGSTSGIVIGAVLGIIGNGDINLIASFALSGMIAGILSRFGRIGVIVRIYHRKYFALIRCKWKYCANNIYKGNTNSIIRTFVDSKEHKNKYTRLFWKRFISSCWKYV